MALQATLIPLPAVRKCTKCKNILPLAEFYKHTTGRDGLNAWCKPCFKQLVLKYAATPKGRKVRNKTNARNRLKVNGRVLALWHAARARAESRNLEFTLTKQWVLERLQRGVCEISGEKFDYSAPGRKASSNPYAPSIDKIDANRGYTPDNCRVICWAFNMAFGYWGEATFLTLFKAYLAHKGDSEI